MAQASSSRHTQSYWERSQRPLQCLLFLLPMLVLYELGAWLYTPEGLSALPAIRAQSLLQDFLEIFGATGYYLPGLAVVVVLMCWHVVRHDPWSLEPDTYGLMLLESLAYTLPLLVFSAVLARVGVLPVLAAPPPPIPTWAAGLLFSIGAGIYEELLFRLIAIALLHSLLVDLAGLSHRYGAAAAVLLSAVAFGLYHFQSFEELEWGRLLFYTAAGVYFAAIYVLRGFGIVVGTHALFDAVVVSLHFAQTGR